MSQPIELYLGKIASATNIEADDNFYFEGTCHPKVKEKSTELETEYYSDDEKTDGRPYEKVKIDSRVEKHEASQNGNQRDIFEEAAISQEVVHSICKANITTNPRPWTF